MEKVHELPSRPHIHFPELRFGITSVSPTIRKLARPVNARVFRGQSANPEALLPVCPPSTRNRRQGPNGPSNVPLRDFGARELDDNVVAHKSLFVLACETFPGLLLSFLVLPLLPAHRCIALFLPLSCICFSMPSASRYLCIGATDLAGWDWPNVFFCRVWAASARK